MTLIVLKETSHGPLTVEPDGSYRFPRVWRAETDSRADREIGVLLAAQGAGFATRVPKLNDPYSSPGESYDAIRCKGLECRLQGFAGQVGLEFRITANYTNQADGGSGGGGPNGDVTLWAPEISYGVQYLEEVIEKDKDDKPIVNSAGSVIDPPLTAPIPIVLIKYTRYESTNPVNYIVPYLNTVNEAAWNGFAPRSCRFAGISSDRVLVVRALGQPSSYVYHTTYEVQVRQSWDKVLLNAGFEARPAVGKPAVATQGRRVLLDKDGVQLANQAPNNATYTDPPFKLYATKDWSPLNIVL